MKETATFNALISFRENELGGKEVLVIFDEESKAQKLLDFVPGYICSANGYMNAVCIPDNYGEI